jgi:hypothetical protein
LVVASTYADISDCLPLTCRAVRAGTGIYRYLSALRRIREQSRARSLLYSTRLGSASGAAKWKLRAQVSTERPAAAYDERLPRAFTRPSNASPYREGQEDQLGALGFALNALVVWNARYMDDAIAYLRATGHEITDEDLKRLSPLRNRSTPA